MYSHISLRYLPYLYSSSLALSLSEDDLVAFLLAGRGGLSVLTFVLTVPALLLRTETDETASLVNDLGLALKTELIAASQCLQHSL